jgi:hypothetical protein
MKYQELKQQLMAAAESTCQELSELPWRKGTFPLPKSIQLRRLMFWEKGIGQGLVKDWSGSNERIPKHLKQVQSLKVWQRVSMLRRRAEAVASWSGMPRHCQQESGQSFQHTGN